MTFAVFPGQGSQHVGMAKDLLENFALARVAFEEASEACKLNLKKLCLDGPDSDLNLTENTQPCLLTASVAAFRVAEAETGFRPSMVAGHSLGEYSALVAAGALSLSQAAFWVRERGKAMQTAVPAGKGGMAAVLNLSDENVAELCQRVSNATHQVLSPANFNSPGQVVIAGSSEALLVAPEMMAADENFKGGRLLPLKVSAPFHCSMMQPARNRMADLFREARPMPLNCQYVPNRTAIPTQESSVIFELLEEQVDHPVLWRQCALQLLAKNPARGIEFGPGKVLQGLLKRCQPDAENPAKLLSVGDSAGIKAMPEFLK